MDGGSMTVTRSGSMFSAWTREAGRQAEREGGREREREE